MASTAKKSTKARGSDITLQWWARSGLMDGVANGSNGTAGRGSLTGMGDHPSGISLYASIVHGLYQRQLTGKGSHVGTVAACQRVLVQWKSWAQAAPVRRTKFVDRPPPRPSRTPECFSTNYYQCRRWALVNSSRSSTRNGSGQFSPSASNGKTLQNDPRFATSTRIE